MEVGNGRLALEDHVSEYQTGGCLHFHDYFRERVP